MPIRLRLLPCFKEAFHYNYIFTFSRIQYKDPLSRTSNNNKQWKLCRKTFTQVVVTSFIELFFHQGGCCKGQKWNDNNFFLNPNDAKRKEKASTFWSYFIEETEVNYFSKHFFFSCCFCDLITFDIA